MNKSSNSAFGEILSKLKYLMPEELTKLKAHVTALSNTSSATTSESDVDIVLKVLYKTILELGSASLPPSVLKKQVDKAIQEKINLVMEWLRRQTQQRVEIEGLLSIGIVGLYEDLVRWQIPPTPRTLLKNIHRIPAKMEVQFPGYASSGILHIIVKSRQSR
jgi:hypothetical protein